MASLTMREIARKHELDLQKEEQQTQTEQPEQESQPDQEQEDVQPEEDSQVEETEVETEEPEQDSEPDEQNQPSKDDGEPDYKNKFERLRKKQSQVEKDKARAEKENQRLQAQIDLLTEQSAKLPQSDDGKQSKKESQPDKQVNDEDVTAYIANNFGEDFDYLDQSTKENIKQMAKQTLEANRKPQSPANIEQNAFSQKDINDIVTQQLADERKKQAFNQYNKDMDEFIKTIDPDVDFVEVMNETAFSDYLDENRREKALFVEASRTSDTYSQEMMKEILMKYLGKSPEPKSNDTTPNTKTKRTKMPKQKKTTVSQDDIDWAYKNLNRHIHRSKALSIIEKAEQEGLI